MAFVGSRAGSGPPPKQPRLRYPAVHRTGGAARAPPLLQLGGGSSTHPRSRGRRVRAAPGPPVRSARPAVPPAAPRWAHPGAAPCSPAAPPPLRAAAAGDYTSQHAARRRAVPCAWRRGEPAAERAGVEVPPCRRGGKCRLRAPAEGSTPCRRLRRVRRAGTRTLAAASGAYGPSAPRLVPAGRGVRAQAAVARRKRRPPGAEGRPPQGSAGPGLFLKAGAAGGGGGAGGAPGGTAGHA